VGGNDLHGAALLLKIRSAQLNAWKITTILAETEKAFFEGLPAPDRKEVRSADKKVFALKRRMPYFDG